MPAVEQPFPNCKLFFGYSVYKMYYIFMLLIMVKLTFHMRQCIEYF